jgi:hypothetical protein
MRSFSILLNTLIILCQAPAVVAQTDSVTYQGVTLQPGDVVNFLGGGATTFNFLKYGHSSLYLGVNPETKQRTFLDFTTEKVDFGEWILGGGTPQPFYGRLLNETNFLNVNSHWHTSFDVFRLKGPRAINKAKMFQEAEQKSYKKSFGLSGEVCSSVVSGVLTKGVCDAAGCKVGGFTPDALAKGDFMRHPDLPVGRSISILAALREAEEDKISREVIQPCKASVIERTGKGENELTDCRACAASEQKQNIEQLHQIRDRELKRCEIRGLEARAKYETDRPLGEQDSAFLQRLRKEIVDLQLKTERK